MQTTQYSPVFDQKSNGLQWPAVNKLIDVVCRPYTRPLSARSVHALGWSVTELQESVSAGCGSGRPGHHAAQQQKQPYCLESTPLRVRRSKGWGRAYPIFVCTGPAILASSYFSGWRGHTDVVACVGLSPQPRLTISTCFCIALHSAVRDAAFLL